jgi:hypothetical protein
MHSVIEIIMPQVEDVEKAVEEIMAPYDESPVEEDEDGLSSHAFWDFYVIGGRWAGWKLTSMLDEDKMDAFYKEMTERNVTVSGLQCGKQELQPASQIPMVDELWASYFPEYKGRACPLFKHANDQYHNDCLYGDVLRIKDVDENLKGMAKVLVASHDFSGEKLVVDFMVQDRVWNGTNYEKTIWDGTLKHALELHAKDISFYKEEYVAKHTVQDDWIMVTVDYHS